MSVAGHLRTLGVVRGDTAYPSAPLSPGDFAALLDIVTEPVLLFRMSSLEIVWANRAARRLCWNTREPLSVSSLTAWAKATLGESLVAQMKASQENGIDNLLMNVVDRQGNARWARIQCLPRGGNGEQLGALVLLPAAAEGSSSQTPSLRRDWLTGLFDREALARRSEALALSPGGRERWCALYFLDLDEFKSVNDRYGHLAGDEVLRVIAQRLLSCLRPDDLVVRFGGDEFVLMVAGLELPDEAERIMARIATALTAPVRTAGLEIEVSVSIGLALGRQTAIDLETLLDQADRSMYRAKARSRGEKAG